MSEQTNQRPSFSTAIIYKDPRSALEWLEKAFGFETTLVISDDQGNPVHSEMTFGNGMIMVGYEWHENAKSPQSIGGANTQNVHVHLREGIDAHCERARAAGATIVAEPEDQFYGDRTYRALDPEGHMWTFGQTVRVTSEAEWEAASGLKVSNSL
ncbi:MAG TPA: VOC family protein [Dehalococcoidia bacterium]|nr:VOC family protein [Dehalococcoidia bacterium]